MKTTLKITGTLAILSSLLWVCITALLPLLSGIIFYYLLSGGIIGMLLFGGIWVICYETYHNRLENEYYSKYE